MNKIQSLNDRIALLEHKISFAHDQVHWLQKENELLTIQKERAESLLIN